MEEPFSLVVPDVLLPDGDGIDLLREIKSTPAPVLPVILKGAMMAGTLARARRPPAFDHRKIVEYAHQRIRSKLDYTNVGFELLPDEAILGENLDKRNFRRKIIQKGIVKPTKEWQQTGRKPAQLYRFSA